MRLGSEQGGCPFHTRGEELPADFDTHVCESNCAWERVTVGRRHGSHRRDQGKRERVNHREGERAELRLKLVVLAGALLSATAFSFGYMGTACYQKDVLLL